MLSQLSETERGASLMRQNDYGSKFISILFSRDHNSAAKPSFLTSKSYCEYQLLYTMVQPFRWSTTPAIVNAYYSATRNQIGE